MTSLAETMVSDPALQLARHDWRITSMPPSLSLRQGIAGELLAAVMVEDLGILLRDFLQRLQAIGREARRDDGNSLHALLGQRSTVLSV